MTSAASEGLGLRSWEAKRHLRHLLKRPGLVNVDSLRTWKWPFIVDFHWIFPLKMVIFHSYVNVYQRLCWKPIEKPLSPRFLLQTWTILSICCVFLWCKLKIFAALKSPADECWWPPRSPSSIPWLLEIAARLPPGKRLKPRGSRIFRLIIFRRITPYKVVPHS